MSISCDSYEGKFIVTQAFSYYHFCTFLAFKNGDCSNCNQGGNVCIRFGFHSRPSYQAVRDKNSSNHNSSPIATYLLTHAQEPFCAAHYKVTVKISESEESKKHGGEIGILFFKLQSQQAETKLTFNTNPLFFGPGSNHTFMTIGDDLNDIETMTVAYKFKQTFNPLTWRVFSPKIYVEFITLESMERNYFVKLCSHQSKTVVHEEKVLFKKNLC